MWWYAFLGEMGIAIDSEPSSTSVQRNVGCFPFLFAEPLIFENVRFSVPMAVLLTRGPGARVFMGLHGPEDQIELYGRTFVRY